MLHYQNERWRERKKKAVDYKGGKCQHCGYLRCIKALEFHHRDPSQKELTGNQIKSMSWEKVVVELDKCDILCSNCHKEVHAEEDE